MSVCERLSVRYIFAKGGMEALGSKKLVCNEQNIELVLDVGSASISMIF